MAVNVYLTLDTRYISKDGTYPIILRLSRNSKNLPIPTGERVPEKYWNEDKREVMNSYKGVTSVTRLNNNLQVKRKEARDIILHLESEGKSESLSLGEIKSLIVRNTVSSSFINFTDELVSDLIDAEQFGTARWYDGTLSVLKDFINGTDKHANNGKAKGNKRELYKGKDLSFKEINYSFLTKLETYHYKNGNGVNGLSAYMRAIRAIYNKAIKADIASKDDYPFDKYKIEGEGTKKLALEWTLLEKMLKATVTPEQECFDTRNYCVASYMMYGMSFVDLAFLQKDSVVNGRINYRRAKSSRLYDIKITPALQEILMHYINLNPNSPFIFPIIKRLSPKNQDADAISGRRSYNEKLRRLAVHCDIPIELIRNMTSRFIRHSFATHARLSGVPVDIIKEMLGHSSIKTTEIYLDSLPQYTLDDYNAQILGGKLL